MVNPSLSFEQHHHQKHHHHHHHHHRGKLSTSPETISVNAPNKMEPSGTKQPFSDPALLNESLQELDEAVASLAVSSRQSNNNNDCSSQLSEIASSQFDDHHHHQDDETTTNYVIDNMERVAAATAATSSKMVAAPPLLRSRSRTSSCRRSSSSRSSRPRGASLERLITDTILKTAAGKAAHFSNDNDDDNSKASTSDILKDLCQTDQVIAIIETSSSSGSGNNSTGNTASPLPPRLARAASPAVEEQQQPKKRNVANLLPRIDTSEDEEPSLLPDEWWQPDWNAAAVDKSACTDDTDPETPNTSSEHHYLPEDGWTLFDSTNPFATKKNSGVAPPPSDVVSLESPSSIVKAFVDWEQGPEQFSFSFNDDDNNNKWGPWSGSQASF